ncbi:hypothetical protein A3J90_01175 [candidate division WOR-1 bacterium RIFOXYC2_FULL_37_10]|uniref:Uncharacterized protein n=1 Tax=candidate division WOR-1 bacterium RIFOXYB2_FULL_37_13 TaxID=1802579 RepID=A0A1F4SSW3_UNCSA|nr:MAG: hypothetical protein A2246_05475 [candidate division WOR-1 bacterium RIFOXYA2_FULL_37_7]OGC23520.1 MAG: hypothetical protein A2310_02840 [candidate division WOR-1 bacterium RIFOXYB2_FULL_37_13]OGC35733.1 MAG: hypothetical protein A3J90_01175 [candidate division WOR-1 bacterium RIFOXYC2_FULL_37_10]
MIGSNNNILPGSSPYLILGRGCSPTSFFSSKVIRSGLAFIGEIRHNPSSSAIREQTITLKIEGSLKAATIFLRNVTKAVSGRKSPLSFKFPEEDTISFKLNVTDHELGAILKLISPEERYHMVFCSENSHKKGEGVAIQAGQPLPSRARIILNFTIMSIEINRDKTVSLETESILSAFPSTKNLYPPLHAGTSDAYSERARTISI